MKTGVSSETTIYARTYVRTSAPPGRFVTPDPVPDISIAEEVPSLHVPAVVVVATFFAPESVSRAFDTSWSIFSMVDVNGVSSSLWQEVV